MSDSSGEEFQSSRYVIGIDLGTTNSAVCYFDTTSNERRVQCFPIPQLIAAGQIEARETLPSFHYQAAQEEFPPGTLAMPWQTAEQSVCEAVGVFAREQGKLVPGRVSESAKSWLCHPGVDRTSPLLPWHGNDDVDQLSPVDVSARYLTHIRNAWNAAHPDQRLEDQDVVITLPASFDEVARELTVAAAKQAGLERVVLIEEPQAAFYAWIHAHRDHWETLVTPGQTILVCDIGGGTSDFTLIRVKTSESGEVQFHRVAVGDHLILGGDNLDLAIAKHVESQLGADVQLSPRQWGSLVRICRQAKETLLGDHAPPTFTVSIPGEGARLIGGGIQIELHRDEVCDVLMSGFFPLVSIDDRPQQAQSGFQEFGLPYATDAAITRHLAAFLSEHVQPDANQELQATRPDIVLLNGGAFLSPVIQQRIVSQMESWFSSHDSPWSPQLLQNDRHDLAVARGAAYYGLVRRGEGVRIAAGLPRTYYMGVTTSDQGQSRQQALAVMSAGAEPGEEVVLDEFEFELTIAAPVQFPLYYSSTRLTDRAGELFEIEREQMTALPPIRTVLKSRKEREAVTIGVVIHARLTELGTLQLWCSEVQGNRSWQLQFDVRSATQTDLTGHAGTGESAGIVDAETLELATVTLLDTFGKDATERPTGVTKQLARVLHQSKEDWPPSLLRNMWEVLMACEGSRARSADHEARWLNLLGYSLRPGFGVALDDWRVSETWKLLRGKLHFTGPTQLTEWWILWRRLAGGLPAGQQLALATPLLTSLKDQAKRPRKSNHKRGRKGHVNSHERSEAWRMLGSLEWLPLKVKLELGELALAAIDEADNDAIAPALLWSLGRIGARQPLYGPLNHVVPIEAAQDWLQRLMVRRAGSAERKFAVMQLARRTHDRYRDLSADLRNQVVSWLQANSAADHFIELVEQGGQLGSREADIAFGEGLPTGLLVRH